MFEKMTRTRLMIKMVRRRVSICDIYCVTKRDKKKSCLKRPLCMFSNNTRIPLNGVQTNASDVFYFIQSTLLVSGDNVIRSHRHLLVPFFLRGKSEWV